MNKEEQIRLEATKRWTELDSLVQRMKIEESSAHREMDELNRKLPMLLVEWAKGTVSRDRVRAVKARIAELREIINDTPLILRELEKEKMQRCFRPLEDACVLSKEREKYNGLKEKMNYHYEAMLEEELRQYARHIGEEEDCEQFLACLSTDIPQAKK
ncbi:MAG: hypothetical protein AAGU11_02390 [Syntrophobacteraceae bacterium]